MDFLRRRGFDLCHLHSIQAKEVMTMSEMKLFSDEELIPWKAEWKDMPEFSHEDLAPKYQVIINFACAADVEEFGKLIGQSVKSNGTAKQMQSFWFPEQEIGRMTNKRYIGSDEHEAEISDLHSDKRQVGKPDDNQDVRCVAGSLYDLRGGTGI